MERLSVFDRTLGKIFPVYEKRGNKSGHYIVLDVGLEKKKNEIKQRGRQKKIPKSHRSEGILRVVLD